MVPHRQCAGLALIAGYFFKCPFCNKNVVFQIAMLDFGIYIPEQMLPGSESLMPSKNCCIGIVGVKQSIVPAQRDLTMQTLKHAGTLFCADIVAHRALMLNVET